MYYFNCVCITVSCDDDPEIRCFTNYRNWSRLSIDEQKRLLVLCYALSPDVFEDKVFFQSDALCQGSSNRFYEISQVRHQVLAVLTIIVAGRTRQVNKIMAYTMSWMHYCCIQPMQELSTFRRTRTTKPTTCTSIIGLHYFLERTLFFLCILIKNHKIYLISYAYNRLKNKWKNFNWLYFTACSLCMIFFAERKICEY
jgi:hypothetical protein